MRPARLVAARVTRYGRMSVSGTGQAPFDREEAGNADGGAPRPAAPVPLGLGGSGTRKGSEGWSFASSSTGERLSPRQLARHLDQYVVGQERAKKVLAVAVYNHYTRLSTMYANTEQGDGSASTSRQPASVPTSSFEWSQYSTHAKQARASPLDESASAEEEEAASRERTREKYKLKTFDKSYSPSLNELEAERERDPTLYESALSASAVKRKRKSIVSFDKDRESRRREDAEAEAAILTDFIGQSRSSAEPQPTSPAPKQIESIQEKSNLLLLGPTGSGKSLLARTLARALDVPFVGVEATGLTMAGYVGEDVETCIHRLLVAAEWDADRASTGIVFIDEVDKLSRSSSASYSKDVSGEGVQQALLKILEGTIVSVPDKEGNARRKAGTTPNTHFVDTTNVLFILSGAFVGLDKIVRSRVAKGSIGFTARLSGDAARDNEHMHDYKQKDEAFLEQVEPADLVTYGFIPESVASHPFTQARALSGEDRFIGRLPVVATLKALTEEDLLRVLIEPKNALVKQYEELFSRSSVELRFTTKALREVARRAVTKGTGARGLRRIMEDTLLDAMFSAPQSSIKYVLVNEAVVKGHKPAFFYSRGQRAMCVSEYEAEEHESERARVVEEQDESQVDHEPDVEEHERRRAHA